MTKQKKVFIFEFDGGSWNVLEPLLSCGKLPVLRRLMDEGAYGILHSDSPTISPRIWTTIFTGKPSEKHGVEFFASTSSNIKQKRLWDIFNDHGLKVGVFGSLVTWPPYPVNGFMIPSIFSLGPETYPADYMILQEIAVSERKKVHKKKNNKGNRSVKSLINKGLKLKSIGTTFETFGSALKYIISEKALRFNPKDRYWRKASLHLKITADVFINLYKKFQPDFSTFHNHLCDAVSHRYWHCYEPGLFKDIPLSDVKKYSRIIPESYILSDKMLGKILSGLDPSTSVIIVSDHGAKALSNTLTPYMLNFDNFLRILQVQDTVIPARFGIKSLLYFTDSRQKEPVLNIIRSISIAETGEKIFEAESKDQYISLNLSPRLLRHEFPDGTRVEINSKPYLFSEICTKQNLKVSGVHHKEGIFIAWGENIKKGAKPMDATVFDIAPTVLTLMGFPVAKDMTGRVLTEIMDDNGLIENPAQYIETYENAETLSEANTEGVPIEIEKVKERLSALGYL
jgi:predicted AlkP superfamily phosphohydrolase/phosphomutase